MATVVIKGALNAVLLGGSNVNWENKGNLFSCATGRTVSIRLDGETGPPQAINCGLPQGSPISPILFMLYISPLFRLEGLKKVFGYADDVSILEVSPSLEINSTRIQKALNTALAWGREEGVTFDPNKSELMHFTRRHKDKGNSPQIITNDFIISENSNRPYL